MPVWPRGTRYNFSSFAYAQLPGRSKANITKLISVRTKRLDSKGKSDDRNDRNPNP
jgi:hypothetical protein